MAVGVCFPRGFVAATASCGMKRDGEDLALVVSAAPAAAAGVFTQNRVAAAPVVVSRGQLASGSARAIVTNSGLANACTGDRGLRDAWTMVETAAAGLDLPCDQVLVASTGVIGRPLPIDRVTAAIERAATGLCKESGAAAAEAIRTTDAFAKTAVAERAIGGGVVRVGGMAKGAGMIRPDMATTLAQITTDARIGPAALKEVLAAAAEGSFNAISVDGCTSTNDCIFLLANGASGVELRRAEDVAEFAGAVAEVAADLARQVVRDGEGTTRVCTYTVSGAADRPAARVAARAVAENVLVKCAMHGGDPNWGRMLAALGAAGVDLDPDRVAVAIGSVEIVRDGTGVDGCERAARAAMDATEVAVDIRIGDGPGEATVIGADLSPAYVSFNAGVTS